MQKQADAQDLQQQSRQIPDAPDGAMHAARFQALAELRDAALGEHQLSVESCDNRESDFRRWLQDKLDAEDKRIVRLREKIVNAMGDFRREYPLDTAEFDASIEALGEYNKMLQALQADDLPRFEARFKELLNENTIREIANFQSQLSRERETIKDRIDRINGSLVQIDYNPGRYILLEPQASQTRTSATSSPTCAAAPTTWWAQAGCPVLGGQVPTGQGHHRSVPRARGPFGAGPALDRQSHRRAQLVPVRRQRALVRGRHRARALPDSGGKSGGQKEKLAYTILAASLAYQFGLEWGEARSRTFRFVVIDEAFGRGSDESAQYGLTLFAKLNLQLLIVTPLQKIHVIEPFVSSVGFVHNEAGRASKLRNLSIAEYRAEKARITG